MGGMGMGAMGGGMPGMGPMGGMMMQQQMQGAGMHGDGGGGGGNNAIHSVMDGALPLYLEDVNWSERLDCKLAAALLLCADMSNPTDSTALDMRMDGSLATKDGRDAHHVSESMALMSGVYMAPAETTANPIATNEMDIDADMAMLDLLDIPEMSGGGGGGGGAVGPSAVDMDDLAMLDMLDIPDVAEL